MIRIQRGLNMLPPASEALNLIDIAAVNNHDWHNNPATLRRTIQILVDHVQYQSVQLSRVEDILAAFGNPAQQGGTVWSKLASKADLSRLEKLEQQLDTALNDINNLRSKQGEAGLRHDENSSRIEFLKDQISGLETKLGYSASIGGFSTSVDVTIQGGMGHGHDYGALPGSGSVIDRMSKLERRLEGLSMSFHKEEEDIAMMNQKLRDTEARAEAAATQLRTDLRQALAITSASSKAEAEAEATARVKESEKRVLLRLQALEESVESKVYEESVESKVSGVSIRVAGSISGEMDKRLLGLTEHIDYQVNQVKAETDRLGREKVDATALEHYTGRVTRLFEQVAGALTEDTRAVADKLGQQMSESQQDLQMQISGKADKRAVQSLEEAMSREEDAMKMLASQVRDIMGQINDSLSAQPRAVEELRSVLASSMQRSQEDMDNVQRSISGLSSALASTGSALEAQAQRSSSLSQKLSRNSAEVDTMRGLLFGATASSAGGTVDQQLSTGSLDSNSVVGRLETLERSAAEVNAALASKVSEADLMDLGRQVAALQRQSDASAEGIRVLTNTTYKRVDEHASAIQKLTLSISSNIEDRPTASAVKHMIDSAVTDSSDRVSSALVPMWEAVKGLQTGVRDAQIEVKSVTREVASLTQQQADLRTRVAGERGALSTLVRRAVDEEISGLARADLQPRVTSLEEGLRQAKAQIETQAQLQDRQHALTTAIEDQVSNQLSASRNASAALRSEVVGKLDSAVAALGQRLDVLEVVSKQQQHDLQAMRDQVSHKLGTAEAKPMIEAGSRSVVKQELGRHKEKEEARWQVWLQQFAETLDGLVARSEVETLLAAASRQTLKDAEQYSTQRVREVSASTRAEITQLRADMELRCEAITGRAAYAENLADSVRDQVGGAVSEAAAAGIRAETSVGAVEKRLKRFEADLSRRVGRAEMDAELAKKLDVRVFLANSTAAAAAASAAAAVTSGMKVSSPLASRVKASPQRAEPVSVPYQFLEGRRLSPGSSDLRRKQSQETGDDDEGLLTASLAAAERLAERVRSRRSTAPVLPT
ncbi:hypothetical protein CEUSTIGMA_g7436.t1 [Chlamydomonas eustigma]|uniref:Uncharacterized protein n=1 Tax=Chlamydomonas eustigma TaxID=1157962 RepID=A0A250XAC9_9CHLO|nr:hypothetical protein CEUSTIGMA_g7436.t1 [Chlamydomonas eustigma]|eukprot:GAX79996.1 hypothetical protein CEUSTIGMA_g7436.t1 [Chlamydomonas eustigma]